MLLPLTKVWGDPWELASEWACANELLWSVIEMVLEGVMPFDLKPHIPIAEQALGNKWQYLVCLCDLFLCHSSSWTLLYWKDIIGVIYYRGTAVIIVLKSFMILWSHLFSFFKCCSLGGKKSWKPCKDCKEIKPGTVKDFQYNANVDPLKSQIIFLLIHCRIRSPQDKTQQCCGVGISSMSICI